MEISLTLFKQHKSLYLSFAETSDLSGFQFPLSLPRLQDNFVTSKKDTAGGGMTPQGTLPRRDGWIDTNTQSQDSSFQGAPELISPGENQVTRKGKTSSIYCNSPLKSKFGFQSPLAYHCFPLSILKQCSLSVLCLVFTCNLCGYVGDRLYGTFHLVQIESLQVFQNKMFIYIVIQGRFSFYKCKQVVNVIAISILI